MNAGLRTLLLPILLIAAEAAGIGPKVMWTHTYGGAGRDIGSAVCQCRDGGYAIAGSTTMPSAGGSDVYLIRTDARGTPVWQRTYGASKDDDAAAVLELPDGGFVICGTTFSFDPSGDISLVCTDSLGDVQWERRIGGTGLDAGNDLIALAEGGFAIVGETRLPGGHSQVLFVRTDTTGLVQALRAYEGPADQGAYAIVRTPDRGYALAGYSTGRDSVSLDALLLKIDSAGVPVWQAVADETSGVTLGLGASDIVLTPDNGFLVAGGVHRFVPDNSDARVVKFDSAGAVSWRASIGGGGDQNAFAALAVPNGYIIAGYARAPSSRLTDAWLVGLDATGNAVWQSSLGTEDGRVARAMVRNWDGTLTLAGQAGPLDTGQSDVFLAALEVFERPRWMSRTDWWIEDGSAQDVVRRADGGFAFALAIERSGGPVPALMLTDSALDLQGYAAMDAPGTQGRARALLAVSGGADGYVLAGDGPRGTLMVRTNRVSPWSQRWVRETGVAPDRWNALAPMSESCYLAAGVTYPSDVDGDMLLSRVSDDGAWVWQHSYGTGDSTEEAHDVQPIPGGRYVVVGESYCPAPESRRIRVLAVDGSGGVLWSRTPELGYPATAHAAVVNPDGSFVTVGSARVGGSLGWGADVCLVKFTASGDLAWARTLGSPLDDDAQDVAATSDGGFVISGSTKSGHGGTDLFIARTDSSGSSYWFETFGSGGDNAGYAVLETGEGKYLAAGDSSGHVYAVWTVSPPLPGVGEPRVGSPYPATGLAVWPSPFRERLSVRGGVGASGFSIYDAAGRCVRVINTGPRSAAVWDGRDDRGLHLPAGVYFVRSGAPAAVPARVVKLD